MNNVDRYAVIGAGVQHSRSPQIHALFAAATHQAMRYGLIDVPPSGFAGAVRDFFASGGRGLNVTVPHKEAAAALASELTPRARCAGAVNTLARGVDDNAVVLLGDNTDGVGLVRDLTVNLGCTLRGARLLLLGAGGAARGVIAPLLESGTKSLVIHNRHGARARQLAREFAALGPVSAAAAANAAKSAAGAGFDIIINATSASLRGELPLIAAQAVGPQTLCYDCAYGERDSVFVHWARSAGAARAVMGFGMLVEQAAESFLLWRGVRPDTAPVLAALAAASGKPT